jgi:hypothetical protein
MYVARALAALLSILTPCHLSIEDNIKILYIIYKEEVPFI